MASPMTDYQAELQRIDDDVESITARNGARSSVLIPDDGGIVRLLYRRFQHAAFKGETGSLRELDAQVDSAIAASQQVTDLWLLKAHIALKRHRFAEAQAALSADALLQQSLAAKLLQSDIDLQQGRYTAAQEAIKAALAENPTWDALARLAHFTATMGDLSAADDLYAAAEDELTAKQMPTFAWLEAQRGWMHFQRGDHDRAIRHYSRADKAYSGYWLVAERIAELKGAQGNFQDALADYKGLYTASPRPEWAHALGELYSLSGAQTEAEMWKQKAYSQYVDVTDNGETYYLHYLVDLCCELAGHADEAVEWARKDVSLRSCFTTQGDLAWALYRAGRHTEALECMEPALASGAVSTRLYTQAGCIYSAAGDRGRGASYMRLSLETNPRPARARIPSIQAVGLAGASSRA